jgi:hypothetical protein
VIIAALLAGCGSKEPCERVCNALEECGDVTDVHHCIDECKPSVEAGGMDGQTDCATIFNALSDCIEDSSCSEHDTVCAAQHSETDRCQ